MSAQSDSQPAPIPGPSASHPWRDGGAIAHPRPGHPWPGVSGHGEQGSPNNMAPHPLPSAKPAPQPRNLPKTAREALRVFFQHPSPRILLLLTLVALAARLLVGGGVNLWDALIPLALLAYWPVNEWLIHVFILHHRPLKLGGFTLDFAIAREHRKHHGDPWNHRYVFISLFVYPFAVPALLAVWWLITPDLPRMWTGLLAYLVLSLHYEWSHYLAHIAWHPPLDYYARRVREHRLHHFRNENYWWGVSMGSADRWFNTAPVAETVARSGSNHDLGLGP